MQEQSFIRVRETLHGRVVIEYLEGVTPQEHDLLRDSLDILSMDKKDALILLEMLKKELEEPDDAEE